MITYDELLEELKRKLEAFRRTIAKEYIPKMYWALRNENPNLAPEDARDRIEKDCLHIIWEKRTIVDALPDEAKDPKKQEFGRLGQKKRNSAAVSAASSADKKAQQIMIKTNGKPVQNGEPSLTTPSISPVNHHSSLSDNNDYVLDFEFSMPWQLLWDWMSTNLYKDEVWFSGIIDKRTSQVISAAMGRKNEKGVIEEIEQQQ
jgi:hypothetical protein